MAPVHHGGHFRLDAANMWLGLNETQAIIITATAAAFIALFGIFSQRAITARQTTLDFIQKNESDRDLIAARVIFNDYAQRSEGLGIWGSDANKSTQVTRNIRMVLNEYELVAVGIGRGMLDDTTYRRWHRSAVVKNWRLAAPYVFAVRARTGNDAIFHEFEQLARWYGPTTPRRRFVLRKFL